MCSEVDLGIGRGQQRKYQTYFSPALESGKSMTKTHVIEEYESVGLFSGLRFKIEVNRNGER